MIDGVLDFTAGDRASAIGNGSKQEIGEFGLVRVVMVKLPGHAIQPRMDAFPVPGRAGEQVTEKLRQRFRHGVAGVFCFLLEVFSPNGASGALAGNPLGCKWPWRSDRQSLLSRASASTMLV